MAQDWLKTKTGILPLFPYEEASPLQRQIYFCRCHRPKRAWQGLCTECWKRERYGSETLSR